MNNAEADDPRSNQMSSEARHLGPFTLPSSSISTCRISTYQLSFAYPTLKVFESLCFEAEGRIIVLRGPSGCGKTTLLKLFAGVLTPTSGHIDQKFNTPVLISQEDALFPWLTGVQNVLKIAKVSLAQLESSPLYSRIAGFVGQKAYQMSFGQRRLIEITRALLIKPDLLCLDEPFNFIDPPSRALIQNLLLGSLQIFRETTFVVSSHYETDFAVAGVADVIFDGELPVNKLTVVHRL